MTRKLVREQAACHVCGASFPVAELRPWITVRPGVSALIEVEAPDWQEGERICQFDLARFRRQYVEQMLEDERGELGALDRAVLDSLESGQTLSRHLENAFDDRITFGERMADRVAAFGGSWPFILIFLGVLTLWIGTNVAGLLRAPFDPYPFILLNLVLSCIAAPPRNQGPSARRERLQREPEGRVGDPPVAREDRPPACASMATPCRDAADPDRDA